MLHYHGTAEKPGAALLTHDVQRWSLTAEAIGASQLRLDGDLRLEWKEAPDGTASAQPQCQLRDGGRILQIDVAASAPWTRLVIPLHRPPGARMMTAELLLRLPRGDADASPGTIEPMLAGRRTPTGRWLDLIANSRPLKKIPLPAGDWQLLSAAFVDHLCPEADLHSTAPLTGVPSFCLLNLPAGRRIEIARLDIDWHPDLTSALPPTEPELTVLAPFALRPLAAPAAADLDLQRGASPPLSAVSQLLGRLPRPPRELAAALIRCAHEPLGLTLLSAFIEGALPNRQGPPLPRPLALNPELLELLIRSHLDPAPERALTRIGQRTLETIAAALCAGERLVAPRSLAVELEGEAAEAAAEALKTPGSGHSTNWQAMREAGVIVPEGAAASQVLRLSRDSRLPMMALAFLSCLESARAGAWLSAEAVAPEGPASWRREIVGYRDGGLPQTSRIGSLSAVTEGAEAAAALQDWAFGEIALGAAGRSAQVTPETAYAVVLNLVPGQDLSHLTNIDHCLCYDSLAALRADSAALSPRLQGKPVVVLGTAPVEADHLLRAVARHWSQGGRNVITALSCSYNRENGHLRLQRPGAVELSPLALLRAVASMPLAELATEGLEEGVFRPACGVAVVLPQALALDDAQMAALRQVFRPDQAPISQHERLALIPPLDSATLAGVERVQNWALGPIISARLFAQRQLRHDLRLFTAQPLQGAAAVQQALEILERLHPASEELNELEEDLAPFLLSLAAQPDLLNTLPSAAFLKYLTLTRQSRALTEIALRLMQVCDQIVLAEVAHVIPLFEVLALSLDAEELAPALAICALHSARSKERFVRRVIEVHGRYAAPASLLLLLTILEREKSKCLEEREMLSKFAPLLGTDYLAALRARIGGDLIGRIEGARGAVTRFAEAARSGDRSAALAILSDYHALASVDFLGWMDGLRSLSNELRDLALPIDAILMDGIDGLARRKLAAVIFSDLDVLDRLRTEGLLDAPDPLHVVALNILGDNRALNAMLAAPFDAQPYAALRISGDSITAVFEHARDTLAGLPRRADGPLVSVIMSAFEPDVALMSAALASLSAQTHEAVEVLVIDDASSPAAAEAIRQLVAAHPIARLIRLEVNSGPYIGRNLALAQAKGRYIAIHDADDWAHPQLFEAQVAILEARPEIRLVTAEHVRVDRAGHVQLERQFAIFGDGPMTSMFRREIFEDLGPFAEVRSRGDVEMRERLRGYYGTHAIHELPLPLKLCLADSATLSQRTAALNGEYLQLWRSSIATRRPIGGLRARGRALGAADHVTIPRRLRAPRMEKI